MKPLAIRRPLKIFISKNRHKKMSGYCSIIINDSPLFTTKYESNLNDAAPIRKRKKKKISEGIGRSCFIFGLI
jgi:hypothetical protein